MYKIIKKLYGIYISMEGYMKPEECKQWRDDLIKATREFKSTGATEFGVFVDMRNLTPMSPESKSFMEEGQKYCKNCGMNRSVVILNGAVVTLQFQKIAKETGISKWERYIDANAYSDWEEIGLNWIRRGIEPIETF